MLSVSSFLENLRNDGVQFPLSGVAEFSTNATGSACSEQMMMSQGGYIGTCWISEGGGVGFGRDREGPLKVSTGIWTSNDGILETESWVQAKRSVNIYALPQDAGKRHQLTSATLLHSNQPTQLP